VNYTALKEEAGIRAVVFDKDNTLTSPYENVLHPAAAPGLARAVAAFGSGGVGTSKCANFSLFLRVKQ
jgi:phosphatidylglycerophosphatase GEP4